MYSSFQAVNTSWVTATRFTTRFSLIEKPSLFSFLISSSSPLLFDIFHSPFKLLDIIYRIVEFFSLDGLLSSYYVARFLSIDSNFNDKYNSNFIIKNKSIPLYIFIARFHKSILRLELIYLIALKYISIMDIFLNVILTWIFVTRIHWVFEYRFKMIITGFHEYWSYVWTLSFVSRLRNICTGHLIPVPDEVNIGLLCSKIINIFSPHLCSLRNLLSKLKIGKNLRFRKLERIPCIS